MPMTLRLPLARQAPTREDSPPPWKPWYRRPNDLRLAARPTRSIRTDASVPIRPLILTPAQWVTHICAETDVLQRGWCVRAIDLLDEVNLGPVLPPAHAATRLDCLLER